MAISMLIMLQCKLWMILNFFGEGDELSRPTRLARNIAANREEFTAYVVKAFQDVEEK